MSPRLAPQPLIEQTRRAAAIFALVRAKLGNPKAATPARLPRKIDPSLVGAWRRAAVALLDAGDQAVWATEEAQRFELAVDEPLLRLSARLCDALDALARAVAADGEAAADALVEAKKHAAEAERFHRLQRKKAHDDPRFVDGLKREGVAKRLSDATEALQKAIDAAAESLAA